MLLRQEIKKGICPTCGKSQGRPVTCHRCGNRWEYMGNSGFNAICPSCGTTIALRKQGGVKTVETSK